MRKMIQVTFLQHMVNQDGKDLSIESLPFHLSRCVRKLISELKKLEKGEKRNLAFKEKM